MIIQGIMPDWMDFFFPVGDVERGAFTFAANRAGAGSFFEAGERVTL